MRKPLLLAGLAGLACLVLVQPARADEDLIVLKEGQGREVVEQNCAACHSLDYIVMNSPILDQAKWEATVKKYPKAGSLPVDMSTSYVAAVSLLLSKVDTLGKGMNLRFDIGVDSWAERP